MKVLILGGTGAMGSHLVEFLLRKGHSVYVTTRSHRKAIRNETFLIGNAHDRIFLDSILQSNEWDAIVDFMVYQTDEFEEKACLFLNYTKQYVFLSSSRVYAETDSLLREDSPRLLDICPDSNYVASDEYAIAKAKQENILKNSGKNNWTIIRPYVTFSESRLQLSCEEKESWLYRALHGRSIVFSSDLADRQTTFTYGADVARGIAAVIGERLALGQAYHITNGDVNRWSDILDAYLDALNDVLGYRPNVFEKSQYALYMGGNVLQVKYDRLYNRKFDNSKINAFVDTSSFMRTKEAVRMCVREFVKHPVWLKINWEYEAMKDRETHEWISAKEWLRISGFKQKVKYILIRLGLYTPKSLRS